jgi:hypothetical protein
MAHVRWCEPDASTSESIEPRNHMLDSVHRRVMCVMQVCACVQVLSRNDVKSGDSSTLVQTVCSVRTFKCSQPTINAGADGVQCAHVQVQPTYDSFTVYDVHSARVIRMRVNGCKRMHSTELASSKFLSVGHLRSGEVESPRKWASGGPDERCWHACRKLSRSH